MLIAYPSLWTGNGYTKGTSFSLETSWKQPGKLQNLLVLEKTKLIPTFKISTEKNNYRNCLKVSNPNITESKSITESWKSSNKHKSLWYFSGGAILVSGKYTVDGSETRRWPVEGTVVCPMIYKDLWIQLMVVWNFWTINSITTEPCHKWNWLNG